MKIGQIIFWAGVAFVAFCMVTQPAATGHLLHSIFVSPLQGAGKSLAYFFNSI